MIRRAVLLALLVLVACDDGRPVSVVGHVGTTTTTATTTTPAPTTSTPTTSPPRRTATSSRSTTVVRSDGVTVVNEGSAMADTGGNVVIGPPDATVANGPATAVGNVSRP